MKCHVIIETDIFTTSLECCTVTFKKFLKKLFYLHLNPIHTGTHCPCPRFRSTLKTMVFQFLTKSCDQGSKPEEKQCEDKVGLSVEFEDVKCVEFFVTVVKINVLHFVLLHEANQLLQTIFYSSTCYKGGLHGNYCMSSRKYNRHVNCSVNSNI